MRRSDGADAVTALTHIAGLVITVGGRYMRQRCSWCGAVLVDYDLSLIAVPIGQDPTPPHWELGALVRIDGGLSCIIPPTAGEHGVEDLPDDSCARLDPEVTV